MISSRQLEERAARRERIISGALEVFKRLGVDGTTIHEIAQESGFGKASLYYYFPSKEDVFLAIMEKGWKELWESIEDIVNEEEHPRRKFLSLLTTLAEKIKQNQVLYEFLFSAPKLLPPDSIKSESWKSYQNRLYATLLGILEDGVAIGEFIDVQPDLLMRAIGGMFHSLLFPGESEKPISEEDLDTILNKFLKPA